LQLCLEETEPGPREAVAQEQVGASAGVEEVEAEWAAIALEQALVVNVFALVAGA